MAHADRRDNGKVIEQASVDVQAFAGCSKAAAPARSTTRDTTAALLEGLMTALHDDPLASASSRFALCGPLDTPPAEDVPSPAGVRPWGLRDLTVAPVMGSPRVIGRFDHERQMVIDPAGRPLVTMGPPTANTTSRVDGEDPPSSEDWRNDYWPDAPAEDPVATAAPAEGPVDHVAGG